MQPSNQATEKQATLCGWVNTYYRYHKGKKLGPYHVRRWKVGPRLFKQYIKPSDLEKIKAACERFREKRKRQSAFAREYTLQQSNLNYLLCLCKRLRKGSLRQEDYAFALEIEKNGYSIPGRPKLRASLPLVSAMNRARQRGKGQGMGVQSSEFKPPFMVPFFANQFSCHPERACESRDLTGIATCTDKHDVLPGRSLSRGLARDDKNINPETMNNDLLPFLKIESEKILRSFETTEQKLERWRSEINSMGPTTQRIPVPKWITEDEIESRLEGLVFPTYNYKPDDDEFRLPMCEYD